ncbi:MAG: tRNA (adenosine(37)-N6)-threonylcarbamoyltransferase complex transferase subunit TsaD [Bacteroidales bacterium]|nr:tRNA (adenosine(37)-N6)-threonylcarbamoyltransferase complex transferase subunit TsaD [Bacteroidales bacterium]
MIYILAIESSCDDTSVAISADNIIIANVVSSQLIHSKYGGVVPELASRAHLKNIVPVIDRAFEIAGINKEDINAIAFTRGPGLLGSLLVGISFAKALAIGYNKALIEADHIHSHILSNFIQKPGVKKAVPSFPFLCLLISGGHTNIVKVTDYLKYETLGETIDDAAGETFDKAAKILGLTYPGGPVIDKLAKEGNPLQYKFSKPYIKDLDFSFSGLKTAFLYFIRDELKKNPGFIKENLHNLAASIQQTIIEILTEKLLKAASQTGINEITIAGGVAANSALKAELQRLSEIHKFNLFVPELEYTTDNAAMIATTAYYKYLKQDFCPLDAIPYSRDLK